MTDTASRELRIGSGIYTFPEAARLTGIPVANLRRWLRGYSYAHGDSRRTQPPVFERDLPDVEHSAALSFLDLVEALFIDAFHRHGVSWKHIRESAERAAALFETKHPFAVRRFATDGRTIFATVFEEDRVDDEKMFELVSGQSVFREVFAPLLKQLEYDVDTVARWWPLGRTVPVVVDPDRARGVPVTQRSGVPTYVLARAVEAEGGGADAIDAVARWYEVPRREVEAAARFEQPIAA